ncbi:membrane dipeptidase [Emticicia sp. CRIBPO]|uniref:dipeptidase n=1 Tax=Emticicia sp. CRIBPO TaxID=2683258 RepID=UPI0014131567|nr:dipeptidase [Emticicia sp. CRIBPO]NBA87729.1 membrane dipeptidase [Emticicia sp. CRIBPO]
MKSKIIILLVFFSQQVLAQSYQQVHQKAILVDTHNDILTQTMEKGFVFDNDLKGKTHSDLKRWKQGGLDVQFFSVWSDGNQVKPFEFAVRQIDSLDAVIKRNPDKIVKVANSTELYKAVNQKKIAALIGVEGGHMIEDDMTKLDYLYKRGVRYMTLTWNNSTPWASSAFDETFSKTLDHKGLSDLGKQIVRRMNTLGMMVDISHVGEKTFWDVIKTTSKPIIASHSSVYNICPHQRNLKDEQIRAIAKNGGVVQVNFYSGFIDSTYQRKSDAFINSHKTESDSLTRLGMADYLVGEYLFSKYPDEVTALRPPLSLLIQHIEYIIKLVGVDYVGLGSDFDGIESAPQQLDDVTSYPLITKALLEKGYSEKDLNKILGGNILRVLKANEAK